MNRLATERELEMIVMGLEKRRTPTFEELLNQIVQSASAATMRQVRPQKPRNWTCKKCGDKFHPNMSKSLCDTCIRKRDGEL